MCVRDFRIIVMDECTNPFNRFTTTQKNDTLIEISTMAGH